MNIPSSYRCPSENGHYCPCTLRRAPTKSMSIPATSQIVLNKPCTNTHYRRPGEGEIHDGSVVCVPDPWINKHQRNARKQTGYQRRVCSCGQICRMGVCVTGLLTIVVVYSSPTHMARFPRRERNRSGAQCIRHSKPWWWKLRDAMTVSIRHIVPLPTFGACQEPWQFGFWCVKPTHYWLRPWHLLASVGWNR